MSGTFRRLPNYYSPPKNIQYSIDSRTLSQTASTHEPPQFCGVVALPFLKCYPLCLSDKQTRRWRISRYGLAPPAGVSRVEGTANATGAAVQDVCVDHRRAHVLVAQQLLDGADIVAFLKQVCGE